MSYASPQPSPYQPAPGRRPATNRPGPLTAVALVLLAIRVVVGALNPILIAVLLRSAHTPSAAYSVISLASGVVLGLLDLAALVLAAVALQRRSGSPVWAGIALGAAGIGLIGIVLSFFASWLRALPL